MLNSPASLAFPWRRSAPSPSWWPYTELLSVCSDLFCTGGPRTGHRTPDVAVSVLSRAEASNLPQPAANTLPNAVQDMVSFCRKGSLLTLFQCGAHQVPQVFFCFPAWWSSTYTWAWSCSSAGFCISASWTSWGSYQTIFPSVQVPR